MNRILFTNVTATFLPIVVAGSFSYSMLDKLKNFILLLPLDPKKQCTTTSICLT